MKIIDPMLLAFILASMVNGIVIKPFIENYFKKN